MFTSQCTYKDVNIDIKLKLVFYEVLRTVKLENGAPNRSRTYNRRIRNPVLYPIELWAHIILNFL